MLRLLFLFASSFMIFTSPANAGEELGRCNASDLTQELVDVYDVWQGDQGDHPLDHYLSENNYGGEPILQGVFRKLTRGPGPTDRLKWVLAAVHYNPIPTGPRWPSIREAYCLDPDVEAPVRSSSECTGDLVAFEPKIGRCVAGSCGGRERKYQICYSQDAFTEASTGGGEFCESDGVPATLERDQTWYILQIDRSVGGETKYCQIEIKTLASGENNPANPPGTGGLRCVGLKPGDPCSGPTSELPDIIEPGEEIEEGDLNGLPAAPAIATPALPGLALAMLAGIIGWVGIIRSRRRRALR